MRLSCIKDPALRMDVKKAIGRYLRWHRELVANWVQANADEANRLDRDRIAEDFMSYEDTRVDALNLHVKKYNVNMYELLDDIAVFIDLNIPRAIYTTGMRLHCKRNSLDFLEEIQKAPYKGIESMPGFQFQYSENYPREKLILEAMEKTSAGVK